MLRGIIEWSQQYRFLIIVIAVAMIVFGIAQLGTMPVDVLPEFAPPYVEVQTEALGLSAQEVEMLVTLNVEELLMGTPWVQTMRSQSVPGLSSVILLFEPGTDIMSARQMVQERLNLAWGMPNVSKPPVILQPLSATSRVMMVGLDSDSLSSIETSVLARWKIRPALMGVDGVANVAIWGQRKRQLQVQVDPEWLRAQGVTLDQVIETTGDALWVSPLTFLNASTSGTGGWIDTPQQRIGIRHVLPISAPDDLAQVIVAGTKGLRLADVADVVENHQPLIGDALLDDGPGLLLVVEKFPGTNTLEVTRGVERKLAEMRPGLADLEIDTTIFRPATFIEMALDNFSATLLIAAILAVVAIGLLFFDWRAALISLVAIVASLVAALLVLYQRGATINSMILAGLVVALGVIIDDAMLDVGHIVRSLRRNHEQGGGESIAAVVLEALLETRSAVVFGTLIVLLAVAPVFFVQDTAGLFYRPLAVSYVLALLASTVVALTVTPALSVSILPISPLRQRASPVMLWLQRLYGKALSWSIRTPRLASVVLVVIVVASIAPLPFLRLEPLPKYNELDIMVGWEGAPGTSHTAVTRLAAEVGAEVMAIPGVRNFATHLGRAVLGDEVVGINSSELWISIDPAADYDTTVAAVEETVDGYPGIVRDVRTYLEETLSRVQTGSSQAMVVRVYGREFDVLRSKAEEVRQALSGIAGVVNLAVELQVEEPYVEIEVDLARADEYGIKPGDVRRAASTLLGGIEAGSLFEDQKVFDVVVWSTPATRHSLTSIRELLLDLPDGGHVRLQDVADVRVASTLSTINREAISRRVDVGFDVQGRDPGAVARNVESVLKQVEFPREFHAELLGGYAQRQAARQRTLVAGVVALIGIYLLLQASVDSWRLAALMLLIVPWALAGGVLVALVVGGGVLSLGGFIGLVTILGIAVRNCIMLIRQYQRITEEGTVSGAEIVLQGTRERLAPILMTAITTGLVVAPFAIAGNVAGHEIVHPMALVILGGLISSILLSLFVVPSLYLRFVSRPESGQ